MNVLYSSKHFTIEFPHTKVGFANIDIVSVSSINLWINFQEDCYPMRSRKSVCLSVMSALSKNRLVYELYLSQK